MLPDFWLECAADTQVRSLAALSEKVNRPRAAIVRDTIAEYLANTGAARERRHAVAARQARLKLPDAIVWASAQVTDRLLVTRDTRDFRPNDPGVRMPYFV